MGSRDDVTITAAALQESAEGLLKMAQQSKPGAWGEAVLDMFPPSIFSVDFDGQALSDALGDDGEYPRVGTGVLAGPEVVERPGNRRVDTKGPAVG